MGRRIGPSSWSAGSATPSRSSAPAPNRLAPMTRFEPSGPLRGALRPPSDKSISHRAALIAAMGEGETPIRGYLDAADTRSTLTAVEALGARVEGADPARIAGEL